MKPYETCFASHELDENTGSDFDLLNHQSMDDAGRLLEDLLGTLPSDAVLKTRIEKSAEGYCATIEVHSSRMNCEYQGRDRSLYTAVDKCAGRIIAHFQATFLEVL